MHNRPTLQATTVAGNSGQQQAIRSAEFPMVPSVTPDNLSTQVLTVSVWTAPLRLDCPRSKGRFGCVCRICMPSLFIFLSVSCLFTLFLDNFYTEFETIGQCSGFHCRFSTTRNGRRVLAHKLIKKYVRRFSRGRRSRPSVTRLAEKYGGPRIQ